MKNEKVDLGQSIDELQTKYFSISREGFDSISWEVIELIFKTYPVRKIIKLLFFTGEVTIPPQSQGPQIINHYSVTDGHKRALKNYER